MRTQHVRVVTDENQNHLGRSDSSECGAILSHSTADNASAQALAVKSRILPCPGTHPLSVELVSLFQLSFRPQFGSARLTAISRPQANAVVTAREVREAADVEEVGGGLARAAGRDERTEVGEVGRNTAGG